MISTCTTPKTGTQNTKLAHIDYDYSPKENFKFAYPNAVFTIGGESGSVVSVQKVTNK